MADENKPNQAKPASQPIDGSNDENYVEDEVRQETLDPRVVDMNSPTGARDLESVYDISVKVSAVLGRSTMPVGNLLKLGKNSVVELDRKVGEAIDIYVNNRLVARGEVVVVDNRLGVTMTEIIKSEKSS